MGRKSAKIALKKGVADKARGYIYTKALKDVFMSAKSGGPDPSSNFLLKVALERCRKFNVPKDNIEKAIKKSQGSDGVGYDDVNYEGYGPEGIAVFIEASTNNVTRTAGSIKNYFKKCAGALATPGSLEFLFERKAIFTLSSEGINEDDFTMHMIDGGAEDVELQEGIYKVKGPMESFGSIQEKLQQIGITPDEATLERIPHNRKNASDEAVEQIEKLIEMLKDDDDVVRVYDNLIEDEE